MDFSTWNDVNNLLQAYADRLDRADFSQLAQLFAPEAIWDYTPGKAIKGRAEIQKFFETRASKFEWTSHFVGSPVVLKNSGTKTLSSTAYFIAAHLLRDGGRYTVYGRYVDTIVSSGSTLWIVHRRVLAHLTEGTNRPYMFIERNRTDGV